MDAFVNFLLDYYIWILSVLGIVIVTIIGFLVDSRQKRKKQLENVVNTGKNVETLPDSKVKDSVPVVDSVNQSVSNVMDNNYVLNPNVSQPVQLHNDMILNNQNSFGNIQTESSLSEQKPHFESRDVNMPISQQTVNSGAYNQVVVPQPVNAVSIKQPVYNQMAQPNVNYQNSVFAANSAVAPGGINLQHSVANIPVSVQPIQNVPVSNVSNSQSIYQNAVSAPAQVQPTDTVQLSNPVTLQAPVNNISGTMYGGQQATYKEQGAPAAEQINSSIGMNFVTGQQNTSNSEDMWKL